MRRKNEEKEKEEKKEEEEETQPPLPPRSVFRFATVCNEQNITPHELLNVWDK